MPVSARRALHQITTGPTTGLMYTGSPQVHRCLPLLALMVALWPAILVAAAAGEAPARSIAARLDEAKQLSDRRAYTEALGILDPLVTEAEGGDPALLGRGLFLQARSHYFMSHYTTALPLLDRALDISRKNGLRAFEGEVQRAIGRVHKQQGTYAEGLRACAEAIAIFDELKQPRDAASTWMSIGGIRDLMADYEQALAAYERARAGLESVRDADYYTLFNEIGITYMNLGRYEDALAAHSKSLEGRERSGDKYLIGISHSNLGETYFALGQYDRAIEHYMQCLRLCGFAGDVRSVAVALGELATAWMAAGNPRRVLE